MSSCGGYIPPRIRVLIAATAQAMQREFKPVKDVSDAAGETWIDAEKRLAIELRKLPKATGTRGQFKGSTDGSGGAVLAPPENNVPTRADLGLEGDAGKKRVANAIMPEDKLEQ